MIINTGGRTDTVNYYSEWLLNRFNEGFVYSRNPMYPQQVYKYKLTPDVVDCVIFCSKNYEPILNRLHEISDKFNIFCHYTITAYDTDIEPNVPSINESIETLIKLSQLIGKEKIAWRYDPILLTPKYTIQKHLETFEYMTSRLAPYISFCIFSFVEIYKKLEQNMPEISELNEQDKNTLANGLGEIARKHNMRIQTCATEEDYTKFGIDISGCMTSKILEQANNIKFKKVSHKGMRKNCRCMPTRDIGAYNTCPNGCKYCYANKNPEIAIRNCKTHNPKSPILLGNILETDIIKDAAQESFLVDQCTLF
ncbi:DUF1848 domain-containing protein [bacterium]|nr:DUF1848 domain-containing protein [bacterium]